MKISNVFSKTVVGTLLAGAMVFNASAQDDFSKVEISFQDLGNGVYMLTGAGGNIGLSVGADGAFMIDDQFAPLSDKIAAAVGKVSDKPVKFLVNTHWHFDHAGGNENFGKRGAVIVAHENVRKRLKTGAVIKAFNRVVEPAAPEALPVVTFADSMTFHWNEQTIDVQHVSEAHTDGDAIIRFNEANVLHLGDTYFNGIFPFIDASSGGSLNGVIASANTALSLADDETRIIPGHGALSNKKELMAYRDMLVDVEKRLRGLRQAGKSDAEIMAAKPLADLDAQWGQGFLKTEVWLGIVLGTL